jgi:hypothetical protein
MANGLPCPDRPNGKARFLVVPLLLLLCPSCRGRTWSAAELEQFYAICAGGTRNAICSCMAKELPKQMTFAEYAEVAAATKTVAPDKLNDEALRKMARAAVVCAKR